MSDMGILRTTIAIESHTRRGELVELADTMVDTGSEYTWVPRPILEGLGIGPERVEHFVTADGRVLARELGFAIVHAAGLPGATRSHFDAQDFCESGTPGLKSTVTSISNQRVSQSVRTAYAAGVMIALSMP